MLKALRPLLTQWERLCQDDNAFLSSLHDATTHHFGICLGLITACLAAAISSIDELSRIGLELVAVAFRLGLASRQRSHRIEESVSSWGATFVNVKSLELRDQISLLNEVSDVRNVQ